MEKIGIIGAMEEEVAFLKSIIKEKKQKNSGGLEFVFGKIGKNEVIVVQSGIGKVNAALCAQRLALEFGATKIINTGIAGALKSGLGILDFVASVDCVQHDFDVTGFGYEPTVIPRMKKSAFVADENLRKAAILAFEELSQNEQFKGHKILEGRIASGDQFISSREKKEKIAKICAPACVEMEGAAIAQACFLNDVPFLVLRCMSDMADNGEESSYKFNDKIAAEMSAKIVQKMLEKI